MASTITNTSDQTCSGKYKGVRKRKWGKWVSEIRLPNSRERIWLGSYDSAKKAARAFDAALYCLRGRHTNFNFPDTPLELEMISVSSDRSRSAQEIQELAARFANEHQQDPPLVQQSSEAEAAGPCSSESERVTENDNYTVQVDQEVEDMRGIDWSFLKSLDEVGSANYSSNNNNNGFYSGLDKMHSGELYPTSPPPLLIDNTNNNGDPMESDDAFSQQSLFLWNF